MTNPAQISDLERTIWAAAWALALRDGAHPLDAMRLAHRAVGVFRNLFEKDQRVLPSERKFLEDMINTVPK